MRPPKRRRWPSGTRDHAPAGDATSSRIRRLRAVEVVSHRLGVLGRCDTVEVDDDGTMTIVEYKATPVRRRLGVTAAMRTQLALQAAALAEMGETVSWHVVYFTQHRARVPVELTPAVGVCLPDERRLTRRPARDPVNAALNYCCGLLLADFLRAIVSCGLDPHAGFLHSSERNKPALALDLCEEFRAPVADLVVVGAFNNGELKSRDFSSVLGSTNLREGGRKALIAAYERRMSGATFQHPVFSCRVTWRRAVEVQARLVLGVVDGTQARYRGVRVR